MMDLRVKGSDGEWIYIRQRDLGQQAGGSYLSVYAVAGHGDVYAQCETDAARDRYARDKERLSELSIDLDAADYLDGEVWKKLNAGSNQ